ncbi:formylglycine-generating enzyme family protein [Aetokthonos hydrillicola Thurmond2011]|jgi:formylglycine-generating enzyme required for sulfatase activity|uniref:Formylglycine-generating enzyme family protein n=1 Tax=Aetokthonos hydrillicola Thurmond2011 TaxID=2712845 RepID=A0AAP5ICQ4_9CYAN|nr:formylglycine-generating enzyme family protein [Aetokthonos hydrillicola]MBO3459904.1 formylglycine-generating enzyme family protein [Aetokthonos hydrillicola CCALA 1050]MBW4584021.1 formylglycine-generating enzyme family protein [Aetokthonos hydrillicola CCALA 1050]MDR9898784.1 formylglycine-generating enzyme family protein [Aetokthonos hydrillicola Thurmond2011]
MTTETDAAQLREQAIQAVDRFVWRFDKSYRLLAYHAALPLVLTPELVNYLRNQFLRGDEVPWVAEVDLLLSDLCSQVGYELYAMDTHVRAYLLGEMKQEYGEQRMREVAQVLYSYVNYLSRLNPGRRQKEIEAQRWAAMVYLGDEKSKEAAKQIAQRLAETTSAADSESITESGTRAEFARLARITEELKYQLQNQPALLECARLVQRLLKTPNDVTQEEVRRSYEVEGVQVSLPNALLPKGFRDRQDTVPTLEGFPPIKPFEFDVATIQVNQSAEVSTDNPLEILQEAVFTKTGKYLQDVERLVLEGTLANQTYEQISASAEYSVRFLSNVAGKLWKVLSEVLGEKVTKKNLQKLVEKWIAHPHLTIHRDRQQAQGFSEDLGNGVHLEMVLIPEGSFLMGSPEDELERSDDESPQHRVSVKQFFMGKYPVTQAQWKAVASLPQVNRELKPEPSHFKGEDRPVESVSWYDAVEFCDRLTRHLSQNTGRSYGLPSEAQWEYACRAGTTTPFHFGETITSDLANYNADYTYGVGVKGISRGETTLVGSFGVANAFGLYDMHGNVWEWCADHWHENYEGASNDETIWLSSDEGSSRVLRGGSWNFNPPSSRCAYRYRFYPDYDNDIGFRVVFDVSPRT